MSNWKETTRKEQISTAIIIFCAIAIIALAVLQLTGVWKSAIYVQEPLLGVLLLAQAWQSWSRNRKAAIVSLCCSALVFLLIIAVFVLHF